MPYIVVVEEGELAEVIELTRFGGTVHRPLRFHDEKVDTYQFGYRRQKAVGDAGASDGLGHPAT